MRFFQVAQQSQLLALDDVEFVLALMSLGLGFVVLLIALFLPREKRKLVLRSLWNRWG